MSEAIGQEQDASTITPKHLLTAALLGLSVTASLAILNVTNLPPLPSLNLPNPNIQNAMRSVDHTLSLIMNYFLILPASLQRMLSFSAMFTLVGASLRSNSDGERFFDPAKMIRNAITGAIAGASYDALISPRDAVLSAKLASAGLLYNVAPIRNLTSRLTMIVLRKSLALGLGFILRLPTPSLRPRF